MSGRVRGRRAGGESAWDCGAVVYALLGRKTVGTTGVQKADHAARTRTFILVTLVAHKGQPTGGERAGESPKPKRKGKKSSSPNWQTVLSELQATKLVQDADFSLFSAK